MSTAPAGQEILVIERTLLNQTDGGEMVYDQRIIARYPEEKNAEAGKYALGRAKEVAHLNKADAPKRVVVLLARTFAAIISFPPAEPRVEWVSLDTPPQKVVRGCGDPDGGGDYYPAK